MSAERAVRATWTPRWLASSAKHRPMPLDAPVMIIRSPRKSRCMGIPLRDIHSLPSLSAVALLLERENWKFHGAWNDSNAANGAVGKAGTTRANGIRAILVYPPPSE